MLGLGLLVRLGRQVLAGPVADSGVLPPGFYRHLVLEALEEEDFPGALHHLKWTREPLLAQIIVLRLRLLSQGHRRRRAAIEAQLAAASDEARREQYRLVLAEEDRALGLLQGYETRALAYLAGPGRSAESAATPEPPGAETA
jgi:hypothetical protein